VEVIEALASVPGVESATAFGQAIHVSGTDRAALEAALAPWRRPPLDWREVKPSLEDVFIHLMNARGRERV
jgi:ABC-2 type transport system ATP-binding protein